MLLGIVPDNSFLDRYKNSSGLLVRNPLGIVPVSPEFSTRMRTMFVAVSPNLVGNGPLMVGLSTISRTSRYLSDQISIGIEPRSPLSDPITIDVIKPSPLQEMNCQLQTSPLNHWPLPQFMCPRKHRYQ